VATAGRVATCVWRVTPELVVALDDRFGEPVDAYVNGSQVWLRDDGPGGITLEWRLHPVAGFRRPPGIDTYELFSSVALAIATGAEPIVGLDKLWDGLECFAAYDQTIEPQPLAANAVVSIGLEPDACGLVDHQRVADQWERTLGGVSITADLLGQLES
jgi:hypothetical protein